MGKEISKFHLKWLGLPAFCACVYAAAHYDMRLFAVALGLGAAVFVGIFYVRPIFIMLSNPVSDDPKFEAAYYDLLTRKGEHLAEKITKARKAKKRLSHFEDELFRVKSEIVAIENGRRRRKYEMAVQK